ncbi:MAG: lysophospholipid acyltransferase family protein [Candidatus Caenarcaniphilales bacterium]|nr:lysophospholipid acyltransferase family protein [Candidatus Caenarcaniphilales bacterium]
MNTSNNLLEKQTDYYDSLHSLAHRLIIYGLLYPFYYLRYRTKIVGQENVPKEGPYVIACNHFSYSDPTIISMVTRQPVAYIAKQELFEGQKKWFSGLITFLGAISINREKPGPSSLKTVKKALKAQWPIGIFIEGTRNQSRTEITRLELGAAFIAKMGGGLPVLPIGIQGGQKVGDKLEIAIGKTIEFDSKLSLEDQTIVYGKAVAELANLEMNVKQI